MKIQVENIIGKDFLSVVKDQIVLVRVSIRGYLLSQNLKKFI